MKEKGVIRPEKTIAKLKAGEDVKIVAIGDSLTYGWMVSKGYLDFLNEMLRKSYPKAWFQIVNKGIPGDTASGGLDRIDTDVYFYNPDCVLVEFALNDAFCGFTSELFGRNIQEMIAGIRKNTKAEVVLVTAVWLDDPASYDFVEKSFYGKLEEMADKFGLPIARVHEHWRRQVQSGAVDFEELVQFDGVHPTVGGYKLMAEAVMEVFKNNT
jgi:lysophospholipase L1-like esterase